MKYFISPVVCHSCRYDRHTDNEENLLGGFYNLAFKFPIRCDLLTLVFTFLLLHLGKKCQVMWSGKKFPALLRSAPFELDTSSAPPIPSRYPLRSNLDLVCVVC